MNIIILTLTCVLSIFISLILAFHQWQLRVGLKECLELTLNQEGSIKFMYQEIVRLRKQKRTRKKEQPKRAKQKTK